MGAICCCPCEEEFEEYTHSSSFSYRHCICLRHFFHRLLSGYSAQRIDGRNVTLSTQGGTPLSPTGLGYVSDDVSLSETCRLVPRSPSYDTDPRYSRSQRDGLVSRHEKSLSHIHEGSQTIKRSCSSSGTMHLGAAKKQDITDIEEKSKTTHPETEKFLSGKVFYDIDYVLTSEDEDICPTCLEDYTADNPKILMKCSHHFHLSCIYEWMERSESCPLCGKAGTSDDRGAGCIFAILCITVVYRSHSPDTSERLDILHEVIKEAFSDRFEVCNFLELDFMGLSSQPSSRGSSLHLSAEEVRSGH